MSLPVDAKRRFPFAALLGALLGLMAVGLGGRLLGRDSDLVLHLAYGKAVLAHGWYAPDSIVYTSTASPILHEWASEVLLALLGRWFGLAGPLLLAALAWATIPSLTLWRDLRHGFWPAAASALITLVALGSSFTVRPHLLSWVCFFIAVHLLENRRGKTWLWLGLLGVVWVNFHGGGALLLPLLAGAYAVGDGLSRRRFSVGDLALLAAPLASLLANPYGFSLWVHLAHFVGLGAANPAQDMHPPDLQSGTLFRFLVVTGFAACVLIRPSRIKAALGSCSRAAVWPPRWRCGSCRSSASSSASWRRRHWPNSSAVRPRFRNHPPAWRQRWEGRAAGRP